MNLKPPKFTGNPAPRGSRNLEQASIEELRADGWLPIWDWMPEGLGNGDGYAGASILMDRELFEQRRVYFNKGGVEVVETWGKPKPGVDVAKITEAMRANIVVRHLEESE